LIRIHSIKLLKQEQAAVEIENKGTIVPYITTMHLIMRYHLEEGQTLSQEEFKRFIKDNEQELLYNKALHFISYQMRTISEVKNHLNKYSTDQSVIHTIIQKLKDAHYLSDSEYVKEYMSEKVEFDLVGPLYIKSKLIQKGIHYDLIDSALIQFTDDVQFEKITTLIEKDIRYKIKKPYRKYIQSLQRKLIQKGFTLDIIDSAILAKQEDIMDQIDDMPLLQEDLKKLFKQHDVSIYKEKQKIIQKLLQKGYALPAIKRQLNQEENHE
jgi:regulatory protein